VELSEISHDLGQAVDLLTFREPVVFVYNPLIYAWEPHLQYLERYGARPKQVLFVGMNPGPFGMAQTGVPFGDVASVRDWLRIHGRVNRPRAEHPKRPVRGFECDRSEISGSRLWGWARERFGTPERFFDRFFVANYCPLAFVEESGRNRTPDKLPEAERVPLYRACDEAIRKIVSLLEPEFVIGIGNFAEKRAREALGSSSGRAISCILHPSPASPKANKNWAETVEAQLRQAGIELPR
jgi:single-strand selective monofunctional uracil DNA glycosylase